MKLSRWLVNTALGVLLVHYGLSIWIRAEMDDREKLCLEQDDFCPLNAHTRLLRDGKCACVTYDPAWEP